MEETHIHKDNPLFANQKERSQSGTTYIRSQSFLCALPPFSIRKKRYIAMTETNPSTTIMRINDESSMLLVFYRFHRKGKYPPVLFYHHKNKHSIRQDK